MQAQSTGRGAWGSKFGFILAAAGSAIGLGNIWGFPYMASQSGGAAFVLVYLICVALLGIPIMFAELAIGRATQRNPVGAFQSLAPREFWWIVGAFGVLAGFAILSFYSVVAGWAVGYLWKAVEGGFATGMTLDQSHDAFMTFLDNKIGILIFTAVFFFLTIFVVQGGVQSGIELASKILMPVFLLLLIGLAARSLTLPGGREGFWFLFNVDFHKLSAEVVMGALGQAFFSLSLGMGAMITYGSYLSKKENLPSAGVIVAAADTLIALLAGLMIFPALFSQGASLGTYKEEGLVFVVLPTIFDTLPMGNVFAIAFYVLLIIAALTSSISLLEVVVAYFVDELKWKRRPAAWLLGVACFGLSAACLYVPGLMGQLITIFYKYGLIVGGLLICIFVGWRWSPRAAIAEMTAEGRTFPMLGFWGVLVKFFCPLVVGTLLVMQVLSTFKSE